MQQFAVHRLCWATMSCWIGLTAVADCADDPNPDVSVVSTPDGVRVQFEDDFSYATGGRQIQVNGRDPQTVGEIHCAMYSYGRVHRPASGLLRLLMIEDDAVQGPDGMPGVLRMEVGNVTLATEYAGFVVYGNQRSGEITMPDWAGGDLSKNQLRNTFITFRFRSENRYNANDFRMNVNFRFEPEMEGSFDWGADFGTLFATRRWRTMRRPLASARNVEAFLAQVNRRRPQRFKLVWRPVNFYEPGDALLIDDVKITIE